VDGSDRPLVVFARVVRFGATETSRDGAMTTCRRPLENTRSLVMVSWHGI
jgi:hypothetical protein